MHTPPFLPLPATLRTCAGLRLPGPYPEATVRPHCPQSPPSPLSNSSPAHAHGWPLGFPLLQTTHACTPLEAPRPSCPSRSASHFSGHPDQTDPKLLPLLVPSECLQPGASGPTAWAASGSTHPPYPAFPPHFPDPFCSQPSCRVLLPLRTLPCGQHLIHEGGPLCQCCLHYSRSCSPVGTCSPRPMQPSPSSAPLALTPPPLKQQLAPWVRITP